MAEPVGMEIIECTVYHCKMAAAACASRYTRHAGTATGWFGDVDPNCSKCQDGKLRAAVIGQNGIKAYRDMVKTSRENFGKYASLIKEKTMPEIIPEKPVVTKECKKCHATKPVETGFHKSPVTKDGYENQCKKCKTDQARESRQAKRTSQPEKPVKPDQTKSKPVKPNKTVLKPFEPMSKVTLRDELQEVNDMFDNQIALIKALSIPHEPTLLVTKKQLVYIRGPVSMGIRCDKLDVQWIDDLQQIINDVKCLIATGDA